LRTHQPRRSRPAGSFASKQRPWSQNNIGNPTQHRGSQNAQKNYERYIALAQAEARAGNSIAAENYYQHAEHYFRSMAPDSAHNGRRIQLCTRPRQRKMPPTVREAAAG
jgi:Domain of unknown function (DUF4167)